jgi:hypothetical protein
VTHTAKVPDFYVVRGGYYEVIDRLRWNNVDLVEVKEDQLMNLRPYRIQTYETVDAPYEGHYLHFNTRVKMANDDEQIQLFRGDVIVYTKNKNRRFIVNVLDPRAPDSYFNWNFFDPILQQKEWYSEYVFEDEAADMLKDPQLKSDFERWKSENNPPARAQLYWLYTKSSHYEKSHLILPVYLKL